MNDAELAARCRGIRLLLADVDGVLTDGAVWYDDRGTELKRFHIRDGQGIRLWRAAGGLFGLVTSRESPAVARRAAELQVDVVRQGVACKLAEVEEICHALGFDLEQVAFVGDDLVDLAAVTRVGLGVAVADAAEELRQAARLVTHLPGGGGAVREVVEVLLKNAGRWEDVLKPYRAP